jgi:apoptotic chromatin condensation inducer in the nucleus
MRRKSTRNAQKSTPDKTPKETGTPPKTRRSRRRKRSPSKSSDSEEEVLTVNKRAPVEETPDTTTKSHTPTDDETAEEPVWKVTSSEDTPKGEIQKLKICLTRPSPDSPDKTKTRRSKSNSQTEDDATSSEDKSSTRRTRSRGSPFKRNDGLSSQEGDEDVEEKKGKGKSKGKHKSKIEKSPHLSEPEIQTNNEISENVQVTPQSPSIDKPVDNENDYNKVDVDDIQNVNESIQRQENINMETTTNVGHNSDNDQENSEVAKTMTESQDDMQNKESDDDKPLSVIQKIASNEKQKIEDQENVEENQQVASDEKQEIQGEEAVTEEQSSNTSDHSANHETIQEETTESEPQLPNVEPIETEQKQELEEECLQHPETDKQELTAEVSGQELTTDDHDQATELHTEEIKKDGKEKSLPEESVEDITETEPQQDISENVVMQEVEESIPVKDDELQESVNSSENVTELEAKSSEPSTETACLANIVEESQQENSAATERNPRRKLKRCNEYVNVDSKETQDHTNIGHIQPSKSKRKWENSTNLISSLFKVDLESIQVVWPSIDFPDEPDLNVDNEKERRRSVTESSGKKLERKVSVEYKSDSSERPSYEKQSSVSSVTQDSEDNSNIIAFNRKISIVDDTASKLKPPPSPAKNPTSNILYITNLVRPFTLKQLKELLERTGKIQEEGFWTDRIKSKCYVQYETQEEAEATRNALHGVQWPIGNGKKLIIDYATEEDLQNAKNPPAPPPVVTVPDTKTSTKENLEPVENKSRNEEKPPKEIEKKRSEGPVREWDIGKKDMHKERSRSRERNRKHKRSPSPPDDFMSRKQRKVEESVPQKLMDDLFLKTKATPSIYWQPLSPEEITMKQQQRLIRMEEHKRRMEENSRMKGRDVGRGAFRRRYD